MRLFIYKGFFVLGFQLQPQSDWVVLGQYGPTVLLLALILFFLLRIAPIYKEVKLKELAVREAENDVKREQAVALGSLASVLKEIAVEQRRATEVVEILQRVNTDESDKLSYNVQRLTERIDQFEEFHRDVKLFNRDLAQRVEKLEGKHVDSEARTAPIQ
ncbi:MAG: hypothetical protein AUG51_17025 [Acidobacteria bacterium 13_1_20CM_3_53_8]|nr:MAG: hypothetical protein AUG51_17025 [Acidobacteria bacterium 13_1_20CM_3_53_8]